MKIEREIVKPDLFNFAKSHLPPSLVADSYGDGYSGEYFLVWQGGCKPWFGRGNPIAEFDGLTIKLFHANYFADMEALAMAYERESGFEVTLKYWQSPKDKPIK